jgi:8-oxo-dGTP pyrophosphatase MutT (NUDIX family)
MRKAVCLILHNKEGKVLAVSRKNNHKLFGLIGGKVDDTDLSLEFAIIREAKEETGLDVFNLKMIDDREYGMTKETLYHQHCFVGEYDGEITPQDELNSLGETGIVKWLDRKELENGFFGEYNKLMFNIIDFDIWN